MQKMRARVCVGLERIIDTHDDCHILYDLVNWIVLREEGKRGGMIRP